MRAGMRLSLWVAVVVLAELGFAGCADAASRRARRVDCYQLSETINREESIARASGYYGERPPFSMSRREVRAARSLPALRAIYNRDCAGRARQEMAERFMVDALMIGLSAAGRGSLRHGHRGAGRPAVAPRSTCAGGSCRRF